MAGSIQKRGKDSYLLRISNGFDEKGKRKYFVKTVHCTSMAKAKTELAKYEAEIRGGVIYSSSKITFSQFVQVWLKDYCEPTLALKTIEGYKNKLELHILPTLGNMKLQNITTYHIQKLYTELSNKKTNRIDSNGNFKVLSQRSIHKVHEILSVIFNCALKWHYIPYNPCKEVTPPKIKQSKMNFYNEEQSKILFSLLDNEPLQYQVATLLAITTGLRRGEILGLHWDDIDFKKNEITIQRSVQYVSGKGIFEKEPKTDSSNRVLSVPSFCMEKISQLKTTQIKESFIKGTIWNRKENVFINEKGDIIHPDTITAWFSKFIKNTDLPSVRFHDLRHTFATILLNKGMNIKTVSANLGHTNLTTTNVYLHAIESANKECANIFENIVNQ